LLDGHNTVKICRERKVKLCEPVVHNFKDREAALQWMETNQFGRRNASEGVKSQLRSKRIDRVAAMRQDGNSLRAIAEEEEVSTAQVRRDLEKAPVPPQGTPAKEVVGKDNKTYPAPPPRILCPRCTRFGIPAKNCPMCQEARKEANKAKRRRPARPTGSKPFNFKEIEKLCGQLVRLVDGYEKQTDQQKSDKGHHLRRIIDEFAVTFKTWVQAKE